MDSQDYYDFEVMAEALRRLSNKHPDRKHYFDRFLSKHLEALILDNWEKSNSIIERNELHYLTFLHFHEEWTIQDLFPDYTEQARITNQPPSENSLDEGAKILCSIEVGFRFEDEINQAATYIINVYLISNGDYMEIASVGDTNDIWVQGF